MITSVNNEKIKYFLKLKQKKYRDQFSKFLIEGEHIVEEALKENKIEYLIKHQNYKGKLFYKEEIVISDNVFEKLSFSKTPQGIMAVCGISEVLFDYHKFTRVLVLDNLQDPGNVGTLIRTALAFGFEGMILSNGSVDIYNDKVIRSTQGAFFKIPMIKGELIDKINLLKENKFNVYTTSLDNAIELNEFEFNRKQKIAIVLGNEGNGVSKEILKIADQSLMIPMTNKMESLNVAIAGSIIMYHLRKI